MNINRRRFLSATGGTAVLLAYQTLSAQDILSQLSESSAAVIRDAQANGLRSDHARWLASNLRIAAYAAQIDERIAGFRDQLRQDPGFYEAVLNAPGVTDEMREMFAARGLDCRDAEYLLAIANRDEREAGLQFVLQNGMQSVLFAAANMADVKAADLDGTLAGRPEPIIICHGMAFSQFSLMGMTIGFNYWMAVTGVAAPELLLILGVLTLTTAVIRYGAC